MGHGYIYKCSKCGNEEQLKVGVGWMYPNPSEVMVDIENGLYGNGAQEFYNRFRESTFVTPYSAIYACQCGAVEERLHIVMSDASEPPARRAFTPRHKCSKCGKIMKLQNEPPLKMPCPKCNEEMKLELEEEILWD